MKEKNEMSDDIVLFPVPKQYLEVVIRALADAMEGRSISSAPPLAASSNPIQTKDPYAEWTKDEITRLKGMHLTRTVRILLNLTAERRGEWVTLREIEEEAGQPPDTIRADLGGFTKLCRRTFHKPHGSIGQHSWPVRVEWKGQNASIQETRYCMLPTIAQWWLEASELRDS